MSGLFPFLGALFPLIWEIYKQYLSANAKAKAANEKFDLNQTTWRAIVKSAVEKQIGKNAGDSAGAGSAWDEADKDPRP